MVKARRYWWICFCLALSLAATSAFAQETEDAEQQEEISAADVEMDDGTGPDGDLVIPKKMAMHCGLSSKDASDETKVKECLDKLAAAGIDLVSIQQDAMHQISKDALEKAVAAKSAAGNYEAIQEDKLGEDSGVQAGSAAAGGEDSADGSDIRTKQTKNIKMSANSSLNLIKIIDIYSARVGLDFMEVFFGIDASYRQARQEEEGGGDD